MFENLKSTPVFEDLEGLVSSKKVYASDGTAAFLTLSKLDLDTDSNLGPDIKVESTHQNQTTIDPSGLWMNSNTIPFIVMPGGFSERHGKSMGMGTLATVFYNGRHCHAVVADIGPKHKYGEGSIALHRALGFERIKNGKIQDIGIDSGVTMLLYIGSNIGRKPFIGSDVAKATEPWYQKFAQSV